MSTTRSARSTSTTATATTRPPRPSAAFARQTGRHCSSTTRTMVPRARRGFERRAPELPGRGVPRAGGPRLLDLRACQVPAHGADLAKCLSSVRARRRRQGHDVAASDRGLRQAHVWPPRIQRAVHEGQSDRRRGRDIWSHAA
eukprot:6440833-Prymnesium_polylepis.1